MFLRAGPPGPHQVRARRPRLRQPPAGLPQGRHRAHVQLRRARARAGPDRLDRHRPGRGRAVQRLRRRLRRAPARHRHGASLCLYARLRDAVPVLARPHKVLRGLPRAEVRRHELVAQVLQEAPDLRPVALVHVQYARLQRRVYVQQQVENGQALRVCAGPRYLQHELQLRARRRAKKLRAQRGHGVLNERLQEPRVHGVRDLVQHVRDRVVGLHAPH